MDDNYFFPFGKVPPRSRIIIYGAGIVGQCYWKQIMRTSYCEVVGFVDRAWKQYKDFSQKVYSPKDIFVLEYDFVVLAFQSIQNRSFVISDLLQAGIPLEKIVYENRIEMNDSMNKIDLCKEGGKTASNSSECMIALQFPSGLGDVIISKRFYDEISALGTDIKFDIYSRMTISDLQAIFFGSNINEMIYDMNGSLYQRNMKNYTMAIYVGTFIHIDVFDYLRLRKKNLKFADTMKKIKEFCDDYGTDAKNFGCIHYYRQYYKKNNAYTFFNCGGILGIDNMYSHIIMNPSYKEEFARLGLKKYITFNYGSGLVYREAIATSNEDIVSKQWPYEYFEEFIRKFREYYQTINIVQLGVENARRVNGTDKTLFGKSLELIKYVLKNSLLHIDIDGGLVHLASNLGTKCVVLYGPTFLEYYGYKSNINIRVGNCHRCYGLYPDTRRCARDMKKPECMYKITPEIVLEKVIEYLHEG